MTTYYNQAEIKTSMKKLVDAYLDECKRCKELSEDFVDLIKHNFLAKYVCYNKATDTIEIGVEDNESEDDFYPEIKVYRYPLDSNKKWLERSFRDGKTDLAFYGRLLTRTKNNKDSNVILF